MPVVPFPQLPPPYPPGAYLCHAESFGPPVVHQLPAPIERVDKLRLCAALSLTPEFVEQYTSTDYVASYQKKQVSIPPMPCVKAGGKSFVVATVNAWLEEWFSISPERRRK